MGARNHYSYQSVFAALRAHETAGHIRAVSSTWTQAGKARIDVTSLSGRSLRMTVDEAHAYLFGLVGGLYTKR